MARNVTRTGLSLIHPNGDPISSFLPPLSPSGTPPPPTGQRQSSEWSDADCLRIMMMLIAIGDPDFVSIGKIRPMAKLPGFSHMPSERHLRRRLRRIAALPNPEERLMALNCNFLKVCCTPFIEKYHGMHSMNFDTSPFNNSGALQREKCTLTYMAEIYGSSLSWVNVESRRLAGSNK